MWTKKLLSLLLIAISLLSLVSACATTGQEDTNPLRYEPTTLPPDHRPPPTSGGPRRGALSAKASAPFHRAG